MAQENEDRLRSAGILKTEDLEPQFRALVEGLTPHEVDMMVAIKRRIDEADRVSGFDGDQGGEPPSEAVFMAP